MWIEVLLVSAAFAAIETDAYTWEEKTALDDYVHYDDGYFSWEILTTYRFEENQTTVYMMNMTSQKWMDETFTSRPVWYHMMAIAIPDVIQHEAAMMWIEGGNNGPNTGPAPPGDDLITLVVNIAEKTGSIGAYLRQVPNQSMVFTNDPDQISRTEDKVIAWTWHTFITTHQDQPEVILRLPMTKAAKRGFDTINELVAQERPGTNVNKFIPSGGSKRGWTTWSIAAADQRVIAAAPCVMSLLNFNDTLQSHYRNLGGWTWVFNDYWVLNLTQHFHDEIVTKSPGGLWDYEDMFRYKERLGLIPKLMISASGDEFFLVTDSHNWWDEMPGPKWIEMVPNAGHSLSQWYNKVAQTIIAFGNKIFKALPMPQLTWFRADTETGGLIRFSTDTVPDEITVWQANTFLNDTGKDFRLTSGYPPNPHLVAWRRVPFQDLGFGNYLIEVNSPARGFTGYFFEASWIVENDLRLTLTSEGQVSPNIFPFPSCYGVECYGSRV